MTTDVVIRAEGLGKKYLIGHQVERERYTSLRDAIVRSAKNWGRALTDLARGTPNVGGDEVEEFWALKAVDFEIRRGDVVGVIGRNGAGKSTLLKILSRITEPSEGRVEIRGRVASLLEVGTGFHPELTGRENVFLNGAILGMQQDEIRRKFDEIVDFAEIEKFLDTPVKRYSSGMYVRLAFAVAAHLEPEILVVDEVLAVGDAAFQRKCLGKMQDVAGGGRTVLFVSHNTSAIHALCRSGMLLEAGRVVMHGDTPTVTQLYASKNEATHIFHRKKPPLPQEQWIQSLELKQERNKLLVSVNIQSETTRRLILNARIKDFASAPVGMASLGGFDPDEMVDISPGLQTVALEIDLPQLANGTYRVDLNLEVPYGHFVDRIDDRLAFDVSNHPTVMHGRTMDSRWGVGTIQLSCALAGRNRA